MKKNSRRVSQLPCIFRRFKILERASIVQIKNGTAVFSHNAMPISHISKGSETRKCHLTMIHSTMHYYWETPKGIEGPPPYGPISSDHHYSFRLSSFSKRKRNRLNLWILHIDIFIDLFLGSTPFDLA